MLFRQENTMLSHFLQESWQNYCFCARNLIVLNSIYEDFFPIQKTRLAYRNLLIFTTLTKDSALHMSMSSSPCNILHFNLHCILIHELEMAIRVLRLSVVLSIIFFINLLFIPAKFYRKSYSLFIYSVPIKKKRYI